MRYLICKNLKSLVKLVTRIPITYVIMHVNVTCKLIFKVCFILHVVGNISLAGRLISYWMPHEFEVR